jgi:hypothetical protein
MTSVKNLFDPNQWIGFNQTAGDPQNTAHLRTPAIIQHANTPKERENPEQELSLR